MQIEKIALQIVGHLQANNFMDIFRQRTENIKVLKHLY